MLSRRAGRAGDGRLLPGRLPARGPPIAPPPSRGGWRCSPPPPRWWSPIDATRLRASPAAAKLAALGTQAPEDKKLLDTFASRTGFDPHAPDLPASRWRFPEEARAHGEFGLVLRAEKLDEPRLIAYVRDELQKSGDDLVATPHGKYVLWSTKRDPSVAGFFVDGQTFALGAGGWAPRMADLAETARPGDSAATNVDLTHLVERAAQARTRSGRRRSSPRPRGAIWRPIRASPRRRRCSR